MTRTAQEVLQADFLLLRSKILDIAATLDRIDRADGSVLNSPQMKLVLEGIQMLSRADGSRAESIQLLFSRQYDPAWRQNMQIDVPER